MTIGANYQPVKLSTNGVTTSFSFDFELKKAKYLVVLLEIAEVQQVVNESEFDLIFDENGGTVNFHTAPEAGGYIIISRNVSLDQETPFKTSSGFQAKRVEESLDKLTAISQQQQEALNRTPKVALGVEVNLTLPQPHAGKALIWNDNEDGLENSEIKPDELTEFMLNVQDSVTRKAAEAAQSADSSQKSASEAANTLTTVSVKAEYSENQANRAKAEANRAELAADSAEVVAQSIYQDFVLLETPVIMLHERKTRYFRVVQENDIFTIDLSHIKQPQKHIAFELILELPTVVNFDLSQILPLTEGETVDDNKNWLNGSNPDLTEAGEHWLLIFSTNGGQTWRASYEGKFNL